MITDRLDRRTVYLLFFFLALGLLLRIPTVATRSLWTDEFFTLFQATGHGTQVDRLINSLSRSPTPVFLQAKELTVFLRNDPGKHLSDVTTGLLNTDTHPPLYFWIMHLWMKAFGDTAVSVRSFSILAGLCAMILAYLIGKELFGTTAALFSALFVGTSPFFVRYAQEARAYTLVLVLGMLSSLFLLRFMKRQKNTDALWFAVFNSLGLYTHYFYIFTAVAHFFYVTIVNRNHSRILTRFYLFFLFSLILFSGWVASVIFRGYNFHLAEWIFGYPGFTNKLFAVITGLGRYFLVFESLDAWALFMAVLALFLFGYFLLPAARGLFKRYPQQIFFCLSLLSVPLLGMFFLDVIQKGALLRQERFWMFGGLGVIPLAGVLLSQGFSRNRLAVYACIAIMLASSVMVGNVEFGPAPKEVSGWINGESRGGSAAVIIYNIRSAVFAQAYYLRGDIYVAPVSDVEQLHSALRFASKQVNRVFVCRHYHSTDALLMDQPFMKVDNPAVFGWRLSSKLFVSNVEAYGYVKK